MNAFAVAATIDQLADWAGFGAGVAPATWE
jgi:hypothetical protein